MSASELERFTADLRADASLRGQFAEKGKDLGAIVDAAQAKGYGLTLADVEGRIAEHGSQLSEEELDQVAGGRASFWVFIGDPRGSGVLVHF
ncbi:Nif11-like leader peptide family RiPP precursor [Methylobacterium sp. J-078]|jgi:predicted ribosomally synthesized peptide with nif11-like leader|uniref:Nif11-like leader peptide family RiPP precursor n=1 Tax=Methylobacterium sp. J-078 TaxID=2836657 RepID=UPI001FBBE021|nr:Nif11-like leader peptide family RiPP precursor [Methylobacterium sp. J-078]MCJ2045951.1 Nif11-like leader peptide family RiPP precursor [Methylobacterium sp. J-078]